MADIGCAFSRDGVVYSTWLSWLAAADDFLRIPGLRNARISKWTDNSLELACDDQGDALTIEYRGSEFNMRLLHAVARCLICWFRPSFPGVPGFRCLVQNPPVFSGNLPTEVQRYGLGFSSPPVCAARTLLILCSGLTEEQRLKASTWEKEELRALLLRLPRVVEVRVTI